MKIGKSYGYEITIYTEKTLIASLRASRQTQNQSHVFLKTSLEKSSFEHFSYVGYQLGLGIAGRGITVFLILVDSEPWDYNREN